MWYIFKFSTYKKFLFVKQLAIHIPGKQPVYLEEDVVAAKL